MDEWRCRLLWSSLKSPIKTVASSRLVQSSRFRHSFRKRLLKDSICPLFHGVPGGMWEMPTRSSQNCCSTADMNSGPLSIRNT